MDVSIKYNNREKEKILLYFIKPSVVVQAKSVFRYPKVLMRIYINRNITFLNVPL